MHIRHAYRLSRHSLHVTSITLFLLFITAFFLKTFERHATTFADGPNYTPIINSIKFTETAGGVAVATTTLLPSSFKQVYLEGSITDANGCEDVASSTLGFINASLSRTGIPACAVNADRDDRNCYLGSLAAGNCTTDCTPGTGMATTTFSCPFKLWWIADATDSGQYASNTWVGSISIQDNGGAAAASSTSFGVATVNSLDIVSSTLNFGNIPIGNKTALDAHFFGVINSGNNNHLNAGLTGTDLLCNWTGMIRARSIRFATTTGVDWNAKILTLITTSTQVALYNLPKAADTTTYPSPNFIYSQFYNQGGGSGTCSGTFTALGM